MPVISKTNPVNWGHPLNYKRLMWWKCLPNSSNSMFDLCGGSSITRGALANGAKYAGGSNNHGIYSAISLDGTDDHVTTISGANLSIGAANQSMSAAFWFNTSTSTLNPDLFAKCTSSAARAFHFYFDTSTNNCFFLHYNGSVVPYAGTVAGGLSSLRNGKWHRVVGVRDCANSVMKIYVDGVDATSVSVNNYFATNFSNTGEIRFGRNDVSNYYSGLFDDATIWLRPLAASDVWADYELGKRFYPGVLNRLSNKVYFILASGLAANPLRGGGAASNTIWGYIG